MCYVSTMRHERDNHLITLLGRKITLDFKNEWKCFKIKWQMENNTWAHVDMEFVRLDSSSDKFQDEKTRIIAKQTMGATQFTKFSDIDFFIPKKTEEILSNTRPKSACGKSSSCRSIFVLSRGKCHYQSY